MLKLEMMLCVMMLPLVVVGWVSKQFGQSCVKPPSPPAWIMQRLDWQTPLNGDYFTLREEADLPGKQLTRTQKY